jgi:glyoxylase-like metal-dependent hydrolase (beta-lactamase superfamily II)
LLQSAGQLYGDRMDYLWGEVAAVPEGNVQVLDGGEVLDLDGRLVEVAYTPGHASHHVSYFDRETSSVFAGDTGGVFLPAAPQFVIPPTPPPDIDLEAWAASLARIRQWHPRRLFVMHFGSTDQPDAHLDSLERQLAKMSELVRATLDEPGTDEERAQRFVAQMHADIRRFVSDADARHYDVAVPLDHCWYGLARYWRKRKGG